MSFDQLVRNFNSMGFKVAGWITEGVLAFLAAVSQLIPSIPEGDTNAQNWVLYGLAALLFARAVQVVVKAIVKAIRDDD